jgi:hypothetical protein
MRRLLLISLAITLVLVLGGCRQRPDRAITRDACSLVTKQEVESVQETPMTEVKSSKQSDGVFLVSQCLYTAHEFNKSVNLALVQRDLKQPNTRNPKDFWKEKFGSNQEGAGQRLETTKAEETEQGSAPKRIDRLGDEAYWVTNRFGGVLYVLKGEAFMSIGIGGTADQETKLQKSKLLAEKALQRL